MKRVVVSGIGVVSPVGIGVRPFWSGLYAGKCAITPALPPLDVIPGLLSASIDAFRDDDRPDGAQALEVDRLGRFGMAAAAQAMDDAGLGATVADDRFGVVLGVSASPTEEHDHIYRRLFAEGKIRTNPTNVPRVMANALSSHLARRHGARGLALTMAGACASSALALGEALTMVRSGRLDMALTGGSDAPLGLANCRSWDALKALSSDMCRPFSRGRSGTVLGEGACMMVIEPLERALARGVRPYAELCGYGHYADCQDMVKPSVDGAAAAMHRALRDAGLAPQDVQHVNAHGTGTLLNDVVETAALRKVFGSHAQNLSVSATKSMHGHALGAAGAIEAAAALMPLCLGVVPPTVNYLGPDADCDLDYVPNHPVSRETEVALSNSFAFGGVNVALLFKRLAEGRALQPISIT